MGALSKMIYPTEYAKSTYEIDFEGLYAKGIRGILFDIDNTLVPHGEPADDAAIALIGRLKEMGFKVCLISNNRKTRVESFALQVHSDYMAGAFKPRRKYYRKAMQVTGTGLEDTIFIGDQVFTDIWGANRTGIRSILVEPIQNKEEVQIKLKRKLEKMVLRKDKKR